jgi:hypothetical protein
LIAEEPPTKIEEDERSGGAKVNKNINLGLFLEPRSIVYHWNRSEELS